MEWSSCLDRRARAHQVAMKKMVKWAIEATCHTETVYVLVEGLTLKVFLGD